MYSSPGTPTGTGRSAASSTYSARVPHRPADRHHAGRVRRARQVQQLTSTAASVGPYRLVQLTRAGEPVVEAPPPAPPAAPRRCRPRARSAAQRPASAASTNCCSMEGTKCSVVTPRRSITSCRYSGRGGPPAAPSPGVAPCCSGQKNSHTETSKPNGVFCSTTSSAPMPKCACIHTRRFTTPRCWFITPLGRPVEPEV